MEQVLKLYVVGESPAGRRAINNVMKMMEGFFHEQWSLEVIDILENPELAVRERIIATPVLIRADPPPFCRIIGDLSDSERVRAYLGQVKRKGVKQW